MRKYIFLFFLLFGVALPAFCGQIVATVNDEPISNYDVEARAKLIAVQKAEYLNDKRKAKYVEEALEAIIHDKIKMNEAKRYHFSVDEKEVDAAVAQLEKQNGLNAGEMVQMLAKNGIPLRVLRDQIRADLLWLQVIQRQRKSLPEVSAADIARKKEDLRAELRREAFFVYEILVPNEKTAEKCYRELQNGAAFDALALKYSRAESKQVGGELGWIDAGHYGKEITSALRGMSSGELSVPLKTKKGYLILLLQDRKTPIKSDTITVWEMAQMAIPTREAVRYEKQLAALNSCLKFTSFAQKYAIPDSVKSGMIAPDQMPVELREILQNEKFQTVVGPVRADDVDVFFMKCRSETKQILPSDDEIRLQIENERMEDLSEKLLRNAKRYAVVERKE